MTAIRHTLLFLLLAGVALANEEAVKKNIGGIDVILRRTTANEVISAKLFIKGGSSALAPNQSPALEGMALTVVSESGSMKRSKDDYQRKLGSMVSTIDGAASRDYSTFEMRCVREHFPDTWTLFTDAILAPRFDSVEVVKDKRNSITAIKSIRSNPDAFVQYLADSLYYQGHPYSRRPTVDEVNAITADDLQKHFAGQFVKSRLLLVVVGNVDETALTKAIESTLGTLPAGSYTPPVLPAINRPSAAVIADKKLPTTYVLGLYAAPNRRQPDYWSTVMATTTLNDRLFEEIRTKRNLSYAPQAGLRADVTAAGLLYVSSTQPDSAMRVMFRCIDSLQNVPMSDKEIKSQVAQFLTTIYLRDETNASQCEALGRYELLTGSWKNSLHVVESVQKITPADVQRSAKQYIHNINFAAVGKAEKIDKAQLESR